MTTLTLQQPIALGRGQLLRIWQGRGIRLRATSGVLWITEQNSLRDHELRPGQVLSLLHKGLALVFAHRAARVIVEVPAGVAPPDSVELATHEGEAGTPIEFVAEDSEAVSLVEFADSRPSWRVPGDHLQPVPDARDAILDEWRIWSM